MVLSGCTYHYRSAIPDYIYTVYKGDSIALYDIPFQNGYIDGVYKEYYPNGQVKNSVLYIKGDAQKGSEQFFDSLGVSTVLYQVRDTLDGNGTLEYIVDGDTIHTEYSNKENSIKESVSHADGSKLLTHSTDGTVTKKVYTDVQGNIFTIDEVDGTVEPIFFAETENGITDDYIDTLIGRFGESREPQKVDSIIDSYGNQWKRRYIHFLTLYGVIPVCINKPVPLLHKSYNLNGAHILIRYIINPDGSVITAYPIFDESKNPIFVSRLIELSDNWNFGPVAGGEYTFDKWYRFVWLDYGEYDLFYYKSKERPNFNWFLSNDETQDDGR